MEKTVLIYVRLPEEETPTVRPTRAVVLENNSYRLLSTADYDPEDEVWEFLPGSIVRGEKTTTANGKEIFLAVERISGGI